MDELWESISIEAQDIIENLLTKNPNERLSVADLLNHSWIQNETILDKMN